MRDRGGGLPNGWLAPKLGRMSRAKTRTGKWLWSGKEYFPAVTAALRAARSSVRLEVYIFSADQVGLRIREELLQACGRGVAVRVLIDTFGSILLPANFWQPLEAAGAEVRWFNPPWFKRLGFRDHRKIVVCDEAEAFVGGFNFTAEYDGDGVHSGWNDLGLELPGAQAVNLARAFDEMFEQAAKAHRPFTRLRRTAASRGGSAPGGELLLSGPGRGFNPFRRRLREDLESARDVSIIAAYFLPTWRLRRELVGVVKRGGRVRLILPGKSDVPMSQFAARSLYRHLLKAGVEIYEFQPQILHTKLILIDGIAYAGSSNLDPRSLYINYELMVRLEAPELTRPAGEHFEQMLRHCEPIELAAWRKQNTWWRRFQQKWSYFVLVHVDPVFVRWRINRVFP